MKYSPERSDFGINFMLVARKWRQVLDGHLAHLGLTDATWVPLVHLQRTGGGITQKQLAALLGIDGSSLVRLLDILTRENLVERRVDAADGRARLVALTPAGEQRVATIRAELEAIEAQMLRGLSDAQLADTRAQFACIDSNLDRMKAEVSAKAMAKEGV